MEGGSDEPTRPRGRGVERGMEGDAALESSLPGVAAWRGGQAGETSKLSCPIIVGFFDNVLHAFTVC